MLSTPQLSYRKLSVPEKIISLALTAVPVKHGKHRLLDSIAPTALGASDLPVQFSVGNRECIVEVDDLVGWHMAMLGAFDPEVVEVLSTCYEDGDVLWDIGANKCACSLFMAIKCDALSVVAIEPQSTLEDINRHNLSQVSNGRYEYFSAGISDAPGELKLSVPSANRGAASFHSPATAAGGVSWEESCKVMTAAQLLAQSAFGAPDLVKIDVEGHEWPVMRSLQRLLEAQRIKALVFENNPGRLDDFKSIYSMVADSGYGLYGIERTPWKTTLREAKKPIVGVNDYAVLNQQAQRAAQNLMTSIA